jgi:hypothetical protein
LRKNNQYFRAIGRAGDFAFDLGCCTANLVFLRKGMISQLSALEMAYFCGMYEGI